MSSSQDDVFEAFAREFIRRHEASRPSQHFERILAATDFSLCSLPALEYAEELARRFGSELLLLHAAGAPSMPAEVLEGSRDAAERVLMRSVEQLRQHGLTVRGLLRPGSAAQEILKTAQVERASVVVMGTHGRSGVARVLMGSVAELVVRGAPCPVLTVGPAKSG